MWQYERSSYSNFAVYAILGFFFSAHCPFVIHLNMLSTFHHACWTLWMNWMQLIQLAKWTEYQSANLSSIYYTLISNMHDLMIKRSTNERSFSRSYMQLQKLLLDSNTLSNTIERHLQTITQQWNLIQECHDLYAVTCLNDEAEIATHDLWIDSYFSKFVEITAQCDKFLLRKPLIRAPILQRM